MFGTLIGGKALRDLVKVIPPGSSPPPECVSLSVEDHVLSSCQLGAADPMFRKAFDIILSDLEAKSKDTAGFVSFRLHVGLRLSRLHSDMPTLCLSMTPDTSSLFSSESAADGIVLLPHEFAVCLCLERVALPGRIAAFVQSRTTVAMQGIDVTPTNQIVPGFKGPVMLEMRNLTDRAVRIPRFFAVAEVFLSNVGVEYSGSAEKYAEVATDLGGLMPGQGKKSVGAKRWGQFVRSNLLALVIISCIVTVMKLLIPKIDLIQMVGTIIPLFIMVMLFSLRPAGLLSETRLMEGIRLLLGRIRQGRQGSGDETGAAEDKRDDQKKKPKKGGKR